jgi:hypothetical protein
MTLSERVRRAGKFEIGSGVPSDSGAWRRRAGRGRKPDPGGAILMRGGLPPSGRYGSNYGRALKRIGGVLPQFGEAPAFLETR